MTPLHQLPGVGQNLQDHLEVYFQLELLKPVSLLPSLKHLLQGPHRSRMAAVQDRPRRHQSFRELRLHPLRAGVEYPDIEYHFLPTAIRYDGKAAAAGHGFQVHVGPMRSKSRGWLKCEIGGAPGSAARIRFNYMSHPDDWVEFRACIRLTREIFEQDALKPYQGARDSAGRASAKRRRARRLHPRPCARARFTPAAPAAWATPPILWRWSIRNAA